MARESRAASAIKLVAVQPILHDGVAVAPGEPLEATLDQAVALMADGAAITPEQAQARAESVAQAQAAEQAAPAAEPAPT